MKILITGGAGFIGANFCFYMMERHPENEYVCLDALTYAGNLKTLEPLLSEPNFKFVHGDIRSKSLVDRLFRKEHFDVVVNFAAETHVDNSILDPDIFLKVNVLGTQVLMDASLKYGIKRFHQVSTDEVYGDLPLNRPDLFFSESSMIRPSSPYSASKAGADLLALAYFRTFGLPVTISRCSNNYGPYQFPEKLIPLMIHNALNGEKLPVYGNGLNVRDWLHVEDHCSAIDAILSKGKPGEVYNVSGNCEKANIDIVRLILKQLDKPESLITYVTDRKGHDLRYALNADKLKSLGWRPEHSFDEGIASTINWYVKNKAWTESLKSRFPTAGKRR